MARRYCQSAIALVAIASCDSVSVQPTTLTLSNKTDTSATVYVSFGSDSIIDADDWPVCHASGKSCKFVVRSGKTIPLPSNDYLNASIAFDGQVACGNTKAELNINNPNWYDILDVSLVDGYSNNIEITATPTGGAEQKFGRPQPTGNNLVPGLYPYGCDICVERESPPCGIAKGKFGCKNGTQYDPDVPCQWKGPRIGGGYLAVDIALVK